MTHQEVRTIDSAKRTIRRAAARLANAGLTYEVTLTVDHNGVKETSTIHRHERFQPELENAKALEAAWAKAEPELLAMGFEPINQQ